VEVGLRVEVGFHEAGRNSLASGGGAGVDAEVDAELDAEVGAQVNAEVYV
jgi:hypothetical protein